MTSPYYQVEQFLLEHDLEKEVVQQTIELFKFLCGEYKNPDFDPDEKMQKILQDNENLRQMYIDALEKYKDSESLSIEALKSKISEQGYDYLTDIFYISDNNLRILHSYLPIIQVLKGTRPGLELIFTALNVGFNIKEWWEDPTNLEILSYILFVELINQPVTTGVIPRLKKFSREYVYPFLAQVTYAVTYKLNKTPHIGAVTYSKTSLKVYQKFLWLIWATDADPKHLWTDQKPYQNPIRHKSLWQDSNQMQLEWANTEESIQEQNTWSDSTDFSDVRVWKYDKSALDIPEDTDLLSWWHTQLDSSNCDLGSECGKYGIPDESWSTEDRTIEDPIITYWAPDLDPDAEKLKDVKLTIIAKPDGSIVEINDEIRDSITVKVGSQVSYNVYDPDGKYLPTSSIVIVEDDMVILVNLSQIASSYTFTLKASPKTAKIEIQSSPFSASSTDTSTPGLSGAISGNYKVVEKTVKAGSKLYWKVSDSDSYQQLGEVVVNSNIEEIVDLTAIPQYTLTLNPTPEDAICTINNIVTRTLTAKTGTKFSWTVSAPNYNKKTGTEILSADKTVDVVLSKLPTFTINAIPENAKVTINGTTKNSISAPAGTTITWNVSLDGYVSESGILTMPTEDAALDVSLEGLARSVYLEADVDCDYTLKVTSGIILGSGNNWITARTGDTISWTAKPTVDTWSASKSGTYVLTAEENQALKIPFTKSTETVTICNLSESKTAEGSSSSTASLTKIYKNDKNDTWVSGKFAAEGAGTLTVTISGKTSVSFGTYTNVSAVANLYMGETESTMKLTQIRASDYVSGGSSSLNCSNKETVEIPAGQKLFYITANGGGSGSLTGLGGGTPKRTSTVSLQVSYTREKWI